MTKTVSLLAAGLLLGAAMPAFAQDEQPKAIPFAGGKLTITETPEQEKILAFNGREIARNYVVLYDRTLELQGNKVALFAVGNGGNACGPATVIVWKPKGAALKTATVGADCGAPPAAATADSLYFVPFLRPGESAGVQSWTPDEGVKLAGELSYAPQPDTHWSDLESGTFDHPYELFANADFYAAAQKVLDGKLPDVALALSVSAEPERTQSGVIYGTGCIPHSCGEGNGFFAVDPKAKAVWFAQQTESSTPDAWPPLDSWPAEIRDVMTKAFSE